MRESGLAFQAVSHLYVTAAMGSGRLQDYANAVALVRSPLQPLALLRALKRIERQAGGRSARPWGPRTLDLDIIDYKGSIHGWRGGKFRRTHARRYPLILPHPSAHLRPFVLTPLAELAPDWLHPVFKRRAATLLQLLQPRRQGRILQRAQRLR